MTFDEKSTLAIPNVDRLINYQVFYLAELSFIQSY